VQRLWTNPVIFIFFSISVFPGYSICFYLQHFMTWAARWHLTCYVVSITEWRVPIVRCANRSTGTDYRVCFCLCLSAVARMYVILVEAFGAPCPACQSCCWFVVQYDLRNNRSFLRRSKVDNVHLCDLFLGSSVSVLGRQLTLVDYANEFTRKRLGYKTERSVYVQFMTFVVLQ